MRRFLVAFIIALSATRVASADDLQSFLDASVKAALDKHHPPAITALIQVDGKVVAETALGVRAAGHPEKITTSDLWHIGSDTKAVTATMIGRLVERGLLKFDDTLAALLPGDAASMNPAYRNVTMIQLLSHTAGLPSLTDDAELPAYMEIIKGANGVMEQRARLARAYLAQPPAVAPGSDFRYSNLGFIIAGAIAERRTGKLWEDLIRTEIFAPLGVKNAGFGPPGNGGAIVDQPRGHIETAGKFVPLDPQSPAADNPPSLGPAGTIHIALRDWVLFAQDQLDGVHGRGMLLKSETYRLLHTPRQPSGQYALGWGVKLGPDNTPVILTHSGSNGFWLADVRIFPKRNIVVLIASNAGNEATETAFKDIRAALMARLKPLD